MLFSISNNFESAETTCSEVTAPSARMKGNKLSGLVFMSQMIENIVGLLGSNKKSSFYKRIRDKY